MSYSPFAFGLTKGETTSSSGQFVLLDNNGDFEFQDSDVLKFGDGADMSVYHTGSAGYITNATGTLNIATETSGIAISIGHTTSEVTVNDNLTVTGDLTVNGTTTSVNQTQIDVTNAFVFEGSTADAHETTLAIVDPTADATINLPAMAAGTYYLPVLAAASTTAISSTPAELNLLDGSVANTVVNSKAVIYGSSGQVKGSSFIVADGGNIGSASDTDAMSISSGGEVSFSVGFDVPSGAQGDILYHDGNKFVRLGAGTDGHFLKTQGTGANPTWAAASGGGGASALNDLSDVTYSSGDLTISSLDTIIAGALTIDSSGDIALSADGGNVTMDDGSTTIFDFDVDGTTLTIHDDQDTGDKVVMTMAQHGAFSIVTTDDDAAAANITITADGTFEADGTTITLDSGGDIVLDAAGDEVVFKDGSTNIGHVSMASDNLTIKSLVNDKDMIFQGVDDSSAITALTLDMSEAGAATFNSSVKGDVFIDSVEIITNDGVTVSKGFTGVTTGGSNRVATLPAAVAGNVGAKYTIKKLDSGAGAVEVTRAGDDTIDGGTTVVLYHQHESVTLIVGAADTWYII
tara:strand:- start:312 stop:2039 length:1728 start_codon:yes stop_codon:yes gene_type:complete